MVIPFSTLSPEALNGLIEEFVSREGTEYGLEEHSLETKVNQVIAALKNGRALIVYDQETETTHIIPTDQYQDKD